MRAVLLLGGLVLFLVVGAGTVASPASRAGRTRAPLRLRRPAQPTNLLLNGDFETGALSPWTGYYPILGGGRGTVVSNPVHGGSFAVQVRTNADPSAASGITGGGQCPGGVRVPVQPNVSYTWSGWILVPANTPFAGAYVRVAWYAANACTGGSQLASVRSSQVTIPTGTWVQVTGTGVAPGNAAFAEVRLLAVPSTAANVVVYFDDLTLDVTPPAPTVTPTPSPSATPTPRCPGQTFADVCPVDWFYPYVTSLSALGAISGYACGGPGEPCYPGNPAYFRPAGTITRAQVCKVVLLAFAIPINSAPQAFADVPPTHPFFDYVNTAANAGVINGYTCGGPGEPCGPGNLPYFRPYNNITRGQVSKVVVLARNWSIVVPTDPSFTDVPPSQPFYPFVETAYAANIVAGYRCGDPGEPCDPQYRRYFRPANHITRAQAAKMVDEARRAQPPSPTPTAAPTHTATPIGTSTPTTPSATPSAPAATSTPAAGTATPTGTSTPTSRSRGGF